MPVRAEAARTGAIDVVLQAPGTLVPRNTVVVRSRVEGQLQRIAFREGQVVRAGDLLAEIDPRPFRVQLAQAEGQLARDEAQLANARLDLARYQGLLAKDAIARQQVDAQLATVRQLEGAVVADRAAVDAAKLQLAYSRVTAPVGGRLGLRQVDLGNVVRAGDANGIVTITETRPIHLLFAIPADALPPVLARWRAGEALRVEAWARDGRGRLAEGRLASIDNAVDPATGTVRMKAEFDNRDDLLFPNQFAQARLLVETRREATLVPSAAIQQGAPGAYVWVVDGERTVSIRPVTVGPAQGEVVAVEKGLAPGELVVVDGTDRLRDGGRVTLPEAGGSGPRSARGEGGQRRDATDAARGGAR